MGVPAPCSPPSRASGRSCWCSRTCTGRTPRCSTSSSSSPRGSTRRCCCSVWPGPSCSTPAPPGPRVRPAALERRGEPPASRRARPPGRPPGRRRRPRGRQPAVPGAARRPRHRARRARRAPAGAPRAARRAARPARPVRPRAARGRGDRGRAVPPRRRAGGRRGRHRRAGGVDALVDRELLLPADPVVAGERAWRFRHALVHDAAYAALPLGARAEVTTDRGLACASVAPAADARIGAHLERAHAASAALRDGAAPALAAGRQPGWQPPREDAHRRGDLPGEIGLLTRADGAARGRRRRPRRAPARARRGAVRGGHARPRRGCGGRGARARRPPRPAARPRRAQPSSASGCASSSIRRRSTRRRPSRCAHDAIAPLERMGDAARPRPRATTSPASSSGCRVAQSRATAARSGSCAMPAGPAAGSRSTPA